MRAGQAMFDELTKDGFYDELSQKTQYLTNGLKQMADKHGIALQVCSVGGMFGLFFADKLPQNFGDVANHCDAKKFAQFFHGMPDEGVYLAPSAFEAAFMSAAHSYEDLDKTIATADKVFASLN